MKLRKVAAKVGYGLALAFAGLGAWILALEWGIIAAWAVITWNGSVVEEVAPAEALGLIIRFHLVMVGAFLLALAVWVAREVRARRRIGSGNCCGVGI